MLNRLPADERRAQLVDSAIAVAERSGIGSVTVRAVAVEAKVSLGVVHYCFENKDALLAAMAEVLIEQLVFGMRLAFGEAAKTAHPHGVEGLRMLLASGLSGVWEVVRVTRPRQLLTYELPSYSLRESAAVAAAQYHAMDEAAISFLSDCAERTDTVWSEPLADVARFALAQIDGIVLRWLVDGNDAATVRLFDNLATVVAAKATAD